MARPCAGGMRVLFVLGVAVVPGGLTRAAEPLARRPVAYRVEATADVEVTCPLPSRAAPRALYRSAAGRWEPVPHELAGDALRVRLRAADLRGGRTTLALDVPPGVDLEDTEPPAAVACVVDGVDAGTASAVDLGGVETAPRGLALSVRDERNALVPESLAVSVNGVRLATAAAGVSLTTLADDARQGTISADLTGLGPWTAPRNTVAISLRDRGLDTPPLAWTLTFRCAPVHRLADGTALAVDSVTTAAGWESWWVVADGKPMAAGDGTTAGRTWLSEETDTPHWLRLSFAAPRTVSGVALWWAFYGCFRTSTAYLVQTWDGAGWVTQQSVQGQAETQCSRHAFGPVTTTQVRIWQPAGAGHPERAGYLWLSEVEAF